MKNHIIIYIVIYSRRKNMRPLKEKISITIDSDLLELLKLKAEDDDRSLSQYINMILKKSVNK